MSLQKCAAGAGIIGFAVALVHYLPGYVADKLIEGSWDWLPHLDSMGETVLFYNQSLRAVAFLLGTVVVLGLGYRVAGGTDLRNDYRGLFLALGLGAFVGYLVGLLIASMTILDGELLGELTTLNATLLVGRLVGASVQLAIAGFAGAALAAVTRPHAGNTI